MAKVEFNMFKQINIFKQKIPQSLFIVCSFFILLTATYISYIPSLSGPFLLDDAVNIKPLELNELTLEELKQKVLSSRFAGISRSLGNVSFAVTQFIYGYEPRPFKGQNILLHLANGLLVFWLMALIIRLSKQHGVIEHQDWWLALVATAIWLLHPIQVSTVAYIVQRLVLMSAFFSLIAAIFYIKGRLIFDRKPALAVMLILIGLGFFWPLGMVSKENAFLLALALLLIEILFFGIRSLPGISKYLLLGMVFIFLILPNIAAILYILLNHNQILLGFDGRDFSLLERILSEIHAIWLYIKLIFFPLPGSMHLFHDDFPVQRTVDLETFIKALGIALSIGVACYLRRKYPLIAFGILWFFIWHLLESTILPLELVFEHRNYIALLGPAILLTATIQALYKQKSLRFLALYVTAFILFLLSANTFSRATTWSSQDSFVGHEYLRSPNSPRAINAMFLFALERKDYSSAAYFLKRLQARVNNETWPLLSELVLRCRDQKNVGNLINEIDKRLEISLIRPSDIVNLRTLAQNVHADKCPALSSEQLIKLIKSAANNHLVHTENVRLGALNLYVRIAGANGDFETAKDKAREALEIAKSSSPVWLRATVQAAADAAAHLESYDDSIAFIKEVTQGYDHVLSQKKIEIKLQLTKNKNKYPE